MEITFNLSNDQAAALRAALAPCFGVESIGSNEDVFITNYNNIPAESSLRGDFEHFADDIGGISAWFDLPDVLFFDHSDCSTNPAALLVLYGNECRLEGHRCALRADGYMNLIEDLPGDIAIKNYETSDNSLEWYQTNSDWV